MPAFPRFPALRSWAAMLLWPRWVQMAPPARMLPYAAGGIVVSGLIYVILQRSHQSVRRAQDHAVLSAGRHRAHHYFHRPDPCAQRHHELSSPTGFWHLSRWPSSWYATFGAKGMVKILPILIGIVVSYIAAPLHGRGGFLPPSSRPTGSAWPSIQAAWPSSASAPASPLRPSHWPP